MEILVITHPTFGAIPEVREVVRIVNQQQAFFRLLVDEAEWIPEFSLGNKSIDPDRVAKEKKKQLGSKPSILITQRPLKGGFFSEYKPNFYLISTSAWEATFPNRPLNLYIVYLIAGILSYFPLRLSERESDLQTERHENETIGCINDYCNTFEDIWQSMLKAHICVECENDLIRLGAKNEHLTSVRQILVLVKDFAWQHEQMECKPGAFMSYTHFDDDHNKGSLTELREYLSKEVKAQTGEEEFPIFQDRKDIKWGQNWRQRIEESINEVTFLIPIITPNFFKSQACRDEVEKFLKREARLKRNDLILPIYYINTPLLNDKKKWESDDLAQAILSHQYADWRSLRFESFRSSKVKKAMEHLAIQIRDALERVAKTSPAAQEYKQQSKVKETEIQHEEIGLLEASEAARDLLKITSEVVTNLNNTIVTVNAKLTRFDALAESPTPENISEAQTIATRVASDLNSSSERLEQHLPNYQKDINIFKGFLSDYLHSVELGTESCNEQKPAYHPMLEGLLASIRASLARLHSHRKSIIDMSHRSGKMKPASRRMAQAVDGMIAPMELFQGFCEKFLERTDEKQKKEHGLEPIEIELLQKIETLNYGGVVAFPKHFEDIGNEEVIRHHLSNLIGGQFIDGGIGSIIQLRPKGIEALRLHGRNEPEKVTNEDRFKMVISDYEKRGSPKYMIDTFFDLSKKEKAELYDRAILWKKGRKSKNNPYLTE